MRGAGDCRGEGGKRAGCFAFDDGKDFCFVERVGTFPAHLASSPPSPAARLLPRDSSWNSACRCGSCKHPLDYSNGKAQSKLPSLSLCRF